MSKVSSEKLRSYLKELTREPHIAGQVSDPCKNNKEFEESKQVNDQARDEALTNWIKETWEAQGGMDEVKLAEYDFYLSWPNASAPNKVRQSNQEVMKLWSFMSHDLGPLD